MTPPAQSAAPCPAKPVEVPAPDAPMICARGLSKQYGRRQAVTDVSFTVHAGQVCALLGPNGAGKTTAMRLLVGLCRPDHGTARLLGQPVHLAANVLSRVGVAIDGPAFVPHLSGRRNLELFWRTGGGIWPPTALEESLELAGLGRDLNTKVKSYSLGMRQRLMLAQALMGAPEVLILDEPANGLDPGEVHALRTHLTRLAERGTAVLLSSHLLAEIELLATHAVVMNAGSVLASGTLHELRGAHSYEFEVDDPELGEQALRAIAGVHNVRRRGQLLSVTAPERSIQELNHTLVVAGAGLRATRASRSLEQAFLDLVGGSDAAR